MDSRLISAIKNLIVKAGHIALSSREKGLDIEWKEDKSPVTNADKEISQFIFQELSRLAPEIPIICEERPIIEIDANKLFWLIDPIDGTRSFIKNKDSFTVNIALIDNRLASYGFIYQPSKELLYFTDENQNFCIEKNGLSINNAPHNLDGFVAVVSSNNFNSKTADYLKENNFSEVISTPSSLKLGLIAEGVGDVYPKFGSTMEWDIAAGHALISAAGGKVCTMLDEQLYYAKEGFLNPSFIATSKKWIGK